MDTRELYERGLKLRKELFGSEAVDKRMLEFGEQLKGLGLDLVGSTRAELDAFRREQTKQIGDIVKAAGVTAK